MPVDSLIIKKVCVKMVPKILTNDKKTEEEITFLQFSSPYSKQQKPN
jgi:hypothetical protein